MRMRSRCACATSSTSRPGVEHAARQRVRAPGPPGHRPRRRSRPRPVARRPHRPRRVAEVVADPLGRAALVGAVVPLEQVGSHLGREARRARPCAGRAPAGWTARDRAAGRAAGRSRSPVARPVLPRGVERDVGAPGVPALAAPLGLAVPDHDDSTRLRGHGRSLPVMDAAGRPVDEVLAELDEARGKRSGPARRAPVRAHVPDGRCRDRAADPRRARPAAVLQRAQPLPLPRAGPARRGGRARASATSCTSLTGGGGSTTSGGTESILMACLVARGRARARGVQRPSSWRRPPRTRRTRRRRTCSTSTTGSRPAGPRRRSGRPRRPSAGGRRADRARRGLGVLLPARRDGRRGCRRGDRVRGGRGLPRRRVRRRHGAALRRARGVRSCQPWDFRVPGVTSMSVDLHKYGYVPKGCSVVLHRDADWAGHQWFVYDQWPAGPLRLTRRGGGEVGGARARRVGGAAAPRTSTDSRDIVRGLLATTATAARRLRVAATGVEVNGDPVGRSCRGARRTRRLDLFAVGDAAGGQRGWFLNRLTGTGGGPAGPARDGVARARGRARRPAAPISPTSYARGRRSAGATSDNAGRYA